MKRSIELKSLGAEHQGEVMNILNYYVENSFAAYPEKKLPDAFYGNLLEMTKGYPAYVVKIDGKVIGFSFLRAYNPVAFNESAEITCFIDKDYSGKGIGKIILNKIEESGKNKGICNILASISSQNASSLKFYEKNGFVECGRFPEIGKKFGKKVDVVYMIKKINHISNN
ncbi:N-acetyltransferase family protein [Desulfobulbus sp.]|uniref:GNAT family N-acetyltransferase n=1 Tax=Desulfobulbus sp. TaxID=895 RepID=UPI00286F55F4|nr:N-acetyltransferase family protein [Desulfobulbus sp.]